MTASQVSAKADGVEEQSACPCCGRSIYEGIGKLVTGDAEIASYSYRWTDGHETRFELAVVPATTSARAPFAVVACHTDGENLQFVVLVAADSPWAETEELGPLLGRDAVLLHGQLPAVHHVGRGPCPPCP